MHQSIHQSIHLTQQFLFQNVFSLFVFFRRFICSIVLPPDNLFALSTVNVAYHVSACRHVTFSRFALLDVYDAVEEIGFPVLAAEVLFLVFREECVSYWGRVCVWVCVERIMGEEKSCRGRTRDMISSWSARWVLQFLQP